MPIWQGENFDENPISQRFSPVKLGESKLILVTENVNYTNKMESINVCRVTLQESEWILATVNLNSHPIWVIEFAIG